MFHKRQKAFSYGWTGKLDGDKSSDKNSFSEYLRDCFPQSTLNVVEFMEQKTTNPQQSQISRFTCLQIICMMGGSQRCS